METIYLSLVYNQGFSHSYSFNLVQLKCMQLFFCTWLFLPWSKRYQFNELYKKVTPDHSRLYDIEIDWSLFICIMYSYLQSRWTASPLPASWIQTNIKGNSRKGFGICRLSCLWQYIRCTQTAETTSPEPFREFPCITILCIISTGLNLLSILTGIILRKLVW